MLTRRAALATLLATTVLRPAHAQSFPSRTITIIVPYPAGGPTDQVARQIAPKLAAKLGQSFVVENVSGGGTNIAGQRVARSAPDGTTLFVHNLQISANVALYKSLPFDTEKDFLPIAMINSNPLVLVGRKTLEAKTLPELVAWMKKNPARMGHPGVGSTGHLATALLAQALGVEVTHVPYRGSAPAANDLIGGQIDYLCGNLGAAAPLIIGKQVKAIAVLSRARSPLMPELASAHEQGLTGMDVTTWTAIFLPKGAPRAIVDKLNEVTQATMETPVIKSRMLEIGVTGVAPDRRSPEYLAKFVEDEVARWEGPIKSGGLQVD